MLCRTLLNVSLAALCAAVAVDGISAQRIVRRQPAKPKAAAADPFAAAGAASARPAIEGGQPVLVVDKASGGPLASAVVFAVDQTVLRSKPTRDYRRQIVKSGVRGFQEQALALAVKFGARYALGADGTTRVPRFANGLVMAASGGRVTQAAIRVDAEETGTPETTRLVLPVRAQIDVIAVTAGGRPAAGIRFYIVERSQWMSSIGESTDARGRTSLPLRREHWDRGGKIKIRPEVLGDEIDVEVDVDAIKKGTAEPVRVTLPDCGTLRVMVFDLSNRPVDRPSVWVRRQIPEGQGHRHYSSTGPSKIENGAALFPLVPLGQALRISARIPGVAGSVEVQHAGPKRAGQVVVVTVDAAKAAGALSMRLLGVDGKPVAKERVGVLLTSTERLDAESAETDADGRLSIQLDERFRKASDVTLKITRRGAGDSTAYRGGTMIDVASLIEADKWSLGDVPLKEEAVLVQGQVVRRDGSPFAGATLSFDPTRRGQYRSSSRSGRDHYWRHEVQTDERGRFEIRDADRDLGNVDLEVKADGHYVVGTASFDAGAKRARIVVDVGGTLLATLKKLPSNKWLSAQVQLRPEQPNEDGKTDYSPQRGNNRTYSFGDLPPGKYTFRLRTGGGEEPVLEVAGLAVERGKALRDARLQDIDWSKWWHEMVVTVVDEKDAPLPDVSVTIWRRSSGGGWSGSGYNTDSKGQMRELAPRKNCTLEIRRDGYRHMWVSSDKIGGKLVLRPGHLVKLSLAKPLELPEGAKLVCDISRDYSRIKRREDRPWRSNDQNGLPVANKSATEVRCSMAGPHKLKLRVVVPRVKGGGQVLRQLLEQSLDIDENAATPVELKIDNRALEQLEEAVEEAKSDGN